MFCCVLHTRGETSVLQKEPKQFWHCTPPCPQACVEKPCWQVLPWQQPNGQVCALHGVWHAPPSQTWFNALQLWHAPPPTPHAPSLSMPLSTQTPAALQQPLQFAGPHGGGAHA